MGLAIAMCLKAPKCTTYVFHFIFRTEWQEIYCIWQSGINARNVTKYIWNKRTRERKKASTQLKKERNGKVFNESQRVESNSARNK
jgi:hypothetical protein